MNCISPVINCQLAAERAWDTFVRAKQASLEDPDNLVAAKRASRLHLEFMQAFTDWVEAEVKVAA